jgi:hypothetical protein
LRRSSTACASRTARCAARRAALPLPPPPAPSNRPRRRCRAQVRLLALELCAELTHRSRVFRALLASRFTRVLELAVGHRREAPLPAPAGAAAALRARALALVERWARAHGARHAQLRLGHEFLRDALRLEFPREDEARAAAEADARRAAARAARAAAERFDRLATEWPATAAVCHSVIVQLDEGLGILDERAVAAAAAVAAASAATAPAPDDAALGWEDVAAAVPPAAEGLGAYAADGVAARSAPDPPPGADPEAAELDALAESLAGAHRELARLAPAAQEALRAAAAAPGGAARDRLLAEATALRADLAAADARYRVALVEAPALGRATARRARRAAARPAPRPRPQALLQPRAPPPRRGTDPYEFIRDPTERVPAPDAVLAAAAAAAAAGRRPAAPPAAPVSAAAPRLSAALRASLAARAPRLPAGAYARVWDSGTAPPLLVNASGLEVQNHWGPVDAHAELPAKRLEEMFLVAPAPAPPPPPAAPVDPDAAGPSAAPPRERLVGKAPPRRPAPPPPELPSAPDPGAALLAAGASGAGRDARRRQRAAERAFNDALIGGGDHDAALARELQDGEAGRGGARKRPRPAGPPARARLEKALLSVRAVGAAVRDAAAAERERRQDRLANQWDGAK